MQYFKKGNLLAYKNTINNESLFNTAAVCVFFFLVRSFSLSHQQRKKMNEEKSKLQEKAF